MIIHVVFLDEETNYLHPTKTTEVSKSSLKQNVSVHDFFIRIKMFFTRIQRFSQFAMMQMGRLCVILNFNNVLQLTSAIIMYVVFNDFHHHKYKCDPKWIAT